MDKQHYLYSGPVKQFDRIVDTCWQASTYAETPKKAKSNLSYRFKKEHNLASNAKISLVDEVTLSEGVM